MDLSKRNFMKGVGLLGAAGAFAAVSSASGQEFTAGAHNSSVFNVKDFGAKGDGQTPDSDAIQKALDAAGKANGTAYFPSGNYRCHDLKVHSNMTVLAEPQWDYRAGYGAVLSIDSEEADCVLNISETKGCRIYGVALRGNRRATKKQHGIFMNHPNEFTSRENCPVIDDVRVYGFSGHGIYLNRIWLFLLRHSMIQSCGGHGICIYGWDGFVLDNQFAANGGSGFGAETEATMIKFTGNRVEWNRRYGLELDSGTRAWGMNSWNVVGNNFDHNGGAGVHINNVNNSTFTGNVFRRNGDNATALFEGAEETCHMIMRRCRGVTVTGNAGGAGRNDRQEGPVKPNYGFWLQGNECCTVGFNTFARGYVRDLKVDKGGHADDFIFQFNVGSQFG